MKAIECDLILHGSCKQFSGGTYPSITAAKKWISECWDRPYTIVRKDKIKLSVPTFDQNIKFVDNVTIEVNKKITTEDYNRICRLLPGLPQGYPEPIFTIGETKKPVPVIDFYDIRQGKAVKKFKGYFITIL